MLEAVNSVIANAPFLRQNAEQISSAQFGVAQNVVSAPQAPYVSPYIFVDNNFDKAVLQIRDSDTGDVLEQYPSKETLAQRARAAEQAAHDREVKESRSTGQNTQTQSAKTNTNTLSNNSYTTAQQIASSTPAQTPASAPISSEAVSAAISAAAQSGSTTPSNVSVQA